jgi:hypothetical protein
VIVTGRKRVVTAWRTSSKIFVVPHSQILPLKKTVLPPIVEEEEDEYVWDSSYGMVHNNDPYDYSEVGDRYFAWKDGIGDIKWVNNGGTF